MSIRTEVNNSIAEVILDHPPVNAFNGTLWNTIPNIITTLGKRQDIKVLLIRAEGRGFCAGVDIKELAENSSAIVEVNKGNYETFKAIHHCEVPVICAPHGFVIGGGIGMCGAADIIIASEDCFFSLPEIDRGAMGGAAHLQRFLPLPKVRAAFFTGEKIPAKEVYRLGGIEMLVSREILHKKARAYAEVIASKSRDALRIAKQALNGIEPFDVDASYRWEQGFTLEMYMLKHSQKARATYMKIDKSTELQEPN
ncbi:enoyl-CoA hydratase family protein [Microbulbifer spongiae]|uniref:Enoyl-CoA hydratase family protein n=1 Tax=Microbulbifer spongiae TaxID=2944933 RepID=A0ABY9E7P1_9GAMM|nr:enoyl-CoA hydratase family protein [Microbulbifer sp. MI-G]WKD49059.1 enoyl-CoA hydratase family protein [Microbulbifer sp. MI-G]